MPEMLELLLVEDDPAIVSTLSDFLQQEGFSITAASGQRQATALLETRRFHLALLDVTLRDGSGFALCTAIKAQYRIPVIFLTALADENSTVTGLEAGGRRLHCQSLFVPGSWSAGFAACFAGPVPVRLPCHLGPIQVDPVRGVATKDGADLLLSPLEYRLLLLFLSNPGVVLSRSRILDEIWDLAGDYVTDNTLTVYIKRLRDKIEPDPQNPTLIRTIRGLGYKAEGAL